MKTRRHFGIAVLGAMLLTLGVTPAAMAAQQSAKAVKPCVLIDSDFDIDDMMAIPQIISNKDVAGIIMTEGYALPRPAAAAAQALYGQAGQTRNPVIVSGATYPAGSRDVSKWPWLPWFRTNMALANGFLSQPILPAPRTMSIPRTVKRLVHGCKSVDVLIIGPFTSFVMYEPSIRSKISRVVMQGKPIQGDSTLPAGHLSFNCEYDLTACRTAFIQMRKLHPTWVDVPRGTTPPYSPSLAMVLALGTTGLPGNLRTALLANPAAWEPNALASGSDQTLLWDQSAATYMLHPKLYQRIGAHWEITVSVAEFQRIWTESVNVWTPAK